MTNDQLIQIEDLKALSSQLEKSWNERVYSNKTLYEDFDLKKLSNTKKEQFDLQISQAPKELKRNGESEIVFPEEWKTRFFVTSEWIVADWSRRHHLRHIDYNEQDPYSPIDCNIDGVNIDVKTTLGLGRRKAIPLHSRLKDQHEIQVAVMSKVANPNIHYATALTQHAIQGIFDSAQYTNINIPLKKFSIEKQYKNSCYFQPLEYYFNVLPAIKGKTKNFDKDVIEYWLKTEVYLTQNIYHPNYNLSACLYSLLDSPERLLDMLTKLLPKIHHDFIPIIIELASKKKIQLLPHYLAEYLVTKIEDKNKIEIDKFNHIIFSIYFPNKYQRLFLSNLMNLINILPEVRCKWHPDEGIEKMGIEYDGDGYIPIFYAKCCQNPKMKTTIYGYSWKTLETVIYKINPSCNNLDCGGLTHKWFDYSFYSKKYKTFCKDSCIAHGRKAHKKIQEDEKQIYDSTNDDDYSPENTFEDIPF